MSSVISLRDDGHHMWRHHKVRQLPGVTGLAARRLASFMMYAVRLLASRWSAIKGRVALQGVGLTSCQGDNNSVKYDYRLNFETGTGCKTGNRQTGNRLTTLSGCIDFAILFVSDGYLRVIYYPPGTGNFVLPGIPGYPLPSLPFTTYHNCLLCANELFRFNGMVLDWCFHTFWGESSLSQWVVANLHHSRCQSVYCRGRFLDLSCFLYSRILWGASYRFDVSYHFADKTIICCHECPHRV